MPAVWAVSGLAGLVLVALAALTVQGGRVRGHSWPAAVIGGLLFPLTWLAWYVHDDPHRAPRSPTV